MPALEAAGIPVLELRADNMDARSADGDALARTVGDWLGQACPRRWLIRRRPCRRCSPGRRPRCSPAR
ncbi:hypothetical protein ABS735_18520 [Streptomyces sp. MMCC 100]|uniref:hypothetical protein n=1 Tax=Streptomyces sp. MMCC 100 TaxID=3163555 RepID=UPI003598FE7A